MLDRFYIPGEWPSDVVALEESEAHHLSHVLRKRQGDRVEIFDGRGRCAEAEVVSISRREAEVRIVTPSLREAVEPATGVSIAVAPPKGDRLKSMIEKLTEVGADRIMLLHTERSVVQPSDAKLDKLEQVAIAACKQCRRNSLPEIVQAATIDAALASCDSQSSLWVADQKGQRAIDTDSIANKSACCFIGPEGGFTATERAQLTSAGARAVSFSPYVLRIETAAMLAAGWLIGRNQPE